MCVGGKGSLLSLQGSEGGVGGRGERGRGGGGRCLARSLGVCMRPCRPWRACVCKREGKSARLARTQRDGGGERERPGRPRSPPSAPSFSLSPQLSVSALFTPSVSFAPCGGPPLTVRLSYTPAEVQPSPLHAWGHPRRPATEVRVEGGVRAGEQPPGNARALGAGPVPPAMRPHTGLGPPLSCCGLGALGPRGGHPGPSLGEWVGMDAGCSRLHGPPPWC